MKAATHKTPDRCRWEWVVIPRVFWTDCGDDRLNIPPSEICGHCGRAIEADGCIFDDYPEQAQ